MNPSCQNDGITWSRLKDLSPELTEMMAQLLSGLMSYQQSLEVTPQLPIELKPQLLTELKPQLLTELPSLFLMGEINLRFRDMKIYSVMAR